MIEHLDLRRNVTDNRLLTYKPISYQNKTVRNEQSVIYFFKLFPRMNFILLIVNLLLALRNFSLLKEKTFNLHLCTIPDDLFHSVPDIKGSKNVHSR